MYFSSSLDLRASMAERRVVCTSSSGGCASAVFEIHMGPLMPGSLRLRCCCLEIGSGVGEEMKWRISLMMTSVLRSHFDDVEERPKVCDAAVCMMKGTLGTKALKLYYSLKLWSSLDSSRRHVHCQWFVRIHLVLLKQWRCCNVLSAPVYERI